MAEQWACAFVLTFGDGGPEEVGVLHVGTEAECDAVAALTPAIAYSGTRHPVTSARIVVGPVSTGDERNGVHV
jgi:hypothetical protein